MNNDQINITIAESRFDIAYCEGSKTCGTFRRYNVFTNRRELLKLVEDYCNDLNAMHVVERELCQMGKESDYWFYLRRAHDFDEGSANWSEVDFFNACTSAARERAEAYLRTIGEWVES